MIVGGVIALIVIGGVVAALFLSGTIGGDSGGSSGGGDGPATKGSDAPTAEPTMPPSPAPTFAPAVCGDVSKFVPCGHQIEWIKTVGKQQSPEKYKTLTLNMSDESYQAFIHASAIALDGEPNLCVYPPCPTVKLAAEICSTAPNACMCVALQSSCGWDAANKTCVPGVQTSCDDCDKQPNCNQPKCEDYNTADCQHYIEDKYTCTGEFSEYMSEFCTDTCNTCMPTPAPPTPASEPGYKHIVVTQNLFWWDLFQNRKGGHFFQTFPKYGPIDILMFEECESVDAVIKGGTYNNIKYEGLGWDMTTYQGPMAVAMAWSNERYEELSKGNAAVAEDQAKQYYGKRYVVWARLKDKISGLVIFAIVHHGPLVVDTGGAAGGQDCANKIMAVINGNKQAGDKVILGGDFNARNGFGAVKYLTPVYNEVAGTSHTMVGQSAMDHMFTDDMNVPVFVETIKEADTGSDHDGLKVSFFFQH